MAYLGRLAGRVNGACPACGINGAVVHNILAGSRSAPEDRAQHIPDRIDLPLAALVALLCVPIFVTDRRISRTEGALFVTAYVVYLGTLIFVRA